MVPPEFIWSGMADNVRPQIKASDKSKKRLVGWEITRWEQFQVLIKKIILKRQIFELKLLSVNVQNKSLLRCHTKPSHFKQQIISFVSSLLQNVMNTTPDVCDTSITNKKMVVTWGQSIHLGCFLKVPKVLEKQTVTWYHYSKEKGRYKIVFR